MGTVATDFLPVTTGFNLGSSAQRWDVFAQVVDVAGTLTVQTLDVAGSMSFAGVAGFQTVGSLVGPEIFQVYATGLGANYNAGSALTVVTPTAIGQFRLSINEYLTRAATSSSTLPSVTVGWTDPGGITRTNTAIATSAANTTATGSSAVLVVFTDGSTPITITSASYATSGVTSMQYALAVTVEAL